MKNSNYSLLTLFIAYLLIIIFFKQLMPIDTSALSTIQKLRTPTLDKIIDITEEVGSLIFIIAIVILLWLKKEKKAAGYFAITLIIDAILVLLLKTIITRPRPEVNTLHPALGYSLPSAHTQRAFASATILSHFYKRFQPIFFFLAIFIGFTRIYAGNHYPLDVIVGAMNGVSIALILLNTGILEKAYKQVKNIYK